jgi:hypothetical protein
MADDVENPATNLKQPGRGRGAGRGKGTRGGRAVVPSG